MGGVHPVPAQMWVGVRPVPAQMWAGVSLVPVQMWPLEQPAHLRLRERVVDVRVGVGALGRDEPEDDVQRSTHRRSAQGEGRRAKGETRSVRDGSQEA